MSQETNKTYGFAVIGCGVISDTHIQAIQALSNARLVAVCDKVAERAQAKAVQFGVEACT